MIYESYKYRMKGDHRAFYVDINIEKLFGSNTHSSPTTSTRGIMSKDRKAVTTYLTHFNNHITENKVYARLHELMTNSNPNHTLAEQIDRELIQAGKHAENACRRRKTNYWNLALSLHKQELSVYCQLRSRRRRNLQSMALMQRAEERGIKISKDITADEITTKINFHKEAIKKCHEESAERRHQFLLDRANIADEENQHKKAQAIRQLRRCEAKCRAYNRPKFNRCTGSAQQHITKLEVPASWPTSQDETDKALDLEDPKTITEQENWREVTCPTEIAFVLKLRNIKHFAQAATDGTPFTTPEMLHKFNWNATT